jgi:hypothetical protein
METLIVNFFYRFTLNSIKVNHQKFINIHNEKDDKLYEKREIKANMIKGTF